MRTDPRELLAVGIDSSLGDRIEMVLRHGRTFSPRASATGVAASTVVLAGLMLAGSLAPRSLIAAAYVRPQVNPDFLIAGGPKWIDSDRFDVDAKASGDFPSAPDGPSAARRLMLQALLADRFKLQVHNETRQRPVCALTFAKSDGAFRNEPGPKLHWSSVDCPGPDCFAKIGPGSLAITGTTLARFAACFRDSWTAW
jgi:uncharacterized protein (TIGR03435 family)